MSEFFSPSVKGIALGDRLWAMAEEGKPLSDLGDVMREELGEIAEGYSAQMLMQSAVLMLASSMGLQLAPITASGSVK